MEKIFDTEVVNEPIDNDDLADTLKEMAMKAAEIPKDFGFIPSAMYLTRYKKLNNLVDDNFDFGKVYGVIQTSSVYQDDVFLDIALSMYTGENQYKLFVAMCDKTYKNEINNTEIIDKDNYHLLVSKEYRFVAVKVNRDVTADNVKEIISSVNTILGAHVTAVLIDSVHLMPSISSSDILYIAKTMNISAVMNYAVYHSVYDQLLNGATTRKNKIATSGLYQFIEGTDVCIVMNRETTEYGVEIISKLIKSRSKSVGHQTTTSIKQLYTDKLKKILDDYSDIQFKFIDDRVFCIDVDENGIELIEQCDGYYSHKLTKQDCFDLSELFKKLGDELTRETTATLNEKESTNEVNDEMGTILGEHCNPKRIWFGYDNSNYTVTCVYDKESDIKPTEGVTILSTNNPEAIDFITRVFISESDTPFIVFPKEFLILRHPTMSYGDIISFKDIDENNQKGTYITLTINYE